MPLNALVLNCTLKAAPEASNAEALAQVVIDALRERGVPAELGRVLDHDVRPGVSSDEDGGQGRPALHAKLLAAEILVIATPTWLGHPRASPSACSSGWTR